MSFGPRNETRACPSCQRALPLPSLDRCPVCGAEVRGPGEPGKALVDAMVSVLSDPLGRRTAR